MQAMILKFGFAALIGTTFVGTFYSQIVRPRLGRLSQPERETPQTEFQWKWLPAAQSNGLRTSLPAATEAAFPDQALNAPESWVAFQGEAFEAVAVGDAFALPSEFGVTLAANKATEPEAPGTVAELLQPEVGDIPATGPGPEQVFQAALLVAELEPRAARGAAAAANAPSLKGPAGSPNQNGEHPTSAVPDPPGNPTTLSATVTPEPATTVLLASGLIALSIAGLVQRRRG